MVEVEVVVVVELVLAVVVLGQGEQVSRQVAQVTLLGQ